MRAVVPYINRRIGDGCGGRLTLSELSAVALMAPCHFHRIFRAVTGEPFHRYVRRVRLEYAAYQLCLSDARVIEIALDAGFQSHSAFTRAFKQQFNQAPAELRHQVGAGDVATVRKVVRPSEKVAFVSHFGAYSEVSDAWESLAAALKARGLDPSRLQGVGVVNDGPEHGLTGHVRYDACAVVPDGFTADGRVGVTVLPPTEAIAVRHHGLPDLIVCSHIRLVVDWLVSGGSPVRPVPYYERYRAFPFLRGDDVVDADILVALRPQDAPR